MTVKMLTPSRVMPMELRALTRMLGVGWYPRVFQFVGLGTFGLILYFAFTGNPHGELNFATVLTWRVWWALLPLSLFLFGKLWCAICPLAVLSDLTQTLRVSPITRRAPRWLRANGAWVMTAFFVALSWAHAIFDIHGTPWLTGVVFIGLAVGAILLALRYEQRAFCRFVCPVGLMGGVYALIALGLLATLVAVYHIARQTQARALPYAALAVTMAAVYFAVYALIDAKYAPYGNPTDTALP